MTDRPVATIVITTKNRKDELRVALASAVQQSVPCEVLVMDDGSTDGTSQMVRDEFPQVVLHRSDESIGLIRQRNRATEMATAPFVFSIDDDAAYVSKRTVEQTLREFDLPEIGAIGIPYVNIHLDSKVFQQAPDDKTVYVIDRYIGVAHAVRRDIFLTLGGYRGHFFQQCEEGDYCIRLMNAGYYIRAGRADPLHHFVSPHRSHKRIVVYNARNHILFAFHNVPGLKMCLYAVGTSIRCLQNNRQHPIWVLSGLAKGIYMCLTGSVKRQPVSRAVFAASRIMKRSAPMPLSAVKLIVGR